MDDNKKSQEKHYASIEELLIDISYAFSFILEDDYDYMEDKILTEVNTKGNMDKTPLFYVITWGEEESAKLLIENGADVNARMEEGYTPLLYATSFGREAIIKLLLENGADINAVNIWGEDCYAIAKQRYPNVIKIFDKFKEKQT